MKYLIDKEKLEARIAELLAGDGRRQADNVEGIALCALRECLVPYEEKKEGCEHKWNGLNECINCGISWYVWKREKNKDNRCTKCNGVGEIEKEFILHGSKYNERMICQHCNGTGKEPRIHHCIPKNCSCGNKAQGLQAEKVFIDEGILGQECPPKCSMWNHEEDTRTHAWETKTYTQDEVRKMLEELKMRDNLAGNSKEVQEDRKHMNTKIDKKIAEL